MAKKSETKDKKGLYVREEGLSKLSAAERKAMEAYAADYMGFLGKAKTERLAYRASVALLEKNGFRPIGECKTLKPGECLEEALAECPCAMLLVSHDRRFLSKVARTEWHFEEIEPGVVELVRLPFAPAV